MIRKVGPRFLAGFAPLVQDDGGWASAGSSPCCPVPQAGRGSRSVAPAQAEASQREDSRTFLGFFAAGLRFFNSLLEYIVPRHLRVPQLQIARSSPAPS